MLDKLAKQTAIYGISTILGRFLSYLLTPFYTRIFGVETYGIITDVYALIPFALVLLTLGMESGFFRFTAKAEAAGGDVAAAKRRIFTTMWGITTLAAAVFFAIIALFAKPCFANSPFVALLSSRSISTSAEVDHRRAALDPRSLFEKSDAKTFRYQSFCVT